MIQSIQIRDFKSYQDATLKLAPLTLLIGANASGKSNALEAIRFLSWMAQGHKLSSLQYLVNDNDRVVRGTVADLPRIGEHSFSFGCCLSEAAEGFRQFETTIDLRQKDELHIRQERVYNPEASGYNLLYQISTPSQQEHTHISIEYNNFARGGTKPQIEGLDQTNVFLQLGNAARFKDGHQQAKRVIPAVCHSFETHLAQILFLDPVPQRMRDYAFLNNRELQGDGNNLSAVLYHLWQEEPEAENNRSAILGFIRSLPEQDILGVDFLKGPRGEVMIQLEESFGGGSRKCDASLLSDGTLRVLALAAALLSAPAGSMVIIEEIDNGVHPSRARQLLDSISQIARQRGLSVLISSHNPALLDALPHEAVPDLVFCYRNPASGHSELVKLADLQDYPELVLQGPLGSLLTQGQIDHFVKLQESPEEKEQKALEWLEKMRNL
ncbi:MAG: AAA family ATPase [Bacteroidia bacterium]|nr:AAA family ATPase [Bacteroidia bacterium]